MTISCMTEAINQNHNTMISTSVSLMNKQKKLLKETLHITATK